MDNWKVAAIIVGVVLLNVGITMICMAAIHASISKIWGDISKIWGDLSKLHHQSGITRVVLGNLNRPVAALLRPLLKLLYLTHRRSPLCLWGEERNVAKGRCRLASSDRF